MNKTDKKLEKLLRETLTEVCDIALVSVNGFSWITHTVDFARVPDSIKVVVVFENELSLAQAKSEREDLFLQSLIVEKLAKAGIKLKQPEKKIFFDSEEACEERYQGDWSLRLKRL